MKNKIWKPLLAPNEQPNLNEINYPLLVSNKIDGIRCILYKGEILSRSLKQIQNKQLREKLQPLADYTREYNLILDGECYSPELTFQQITSMVMTQDFSDPKSIKKYGEVKKIPNHLKFHCFDAIKDDNLDVPFIDRVKLVETVAMLFEDIMYPVQEYLLNNKEEVEKHFEIALDNGEEGLILRSPEGKYKCGRCTLKEQNVFKLKPYINFDAQVTGVVQSTEVDPNAEKKTNELGRSVTSKKKEDRILIEKASAFWVKYCTECNGTGKAMNGSEPCTCPFCKDLKVVLAKTDEEKEEIWRNKESYIGKWIQYKGMMIGAKDVPRHPVMERFREDKD